MPPFPPGQLPQLIAAVRQADTTATKGRALEDLICALFSWVSGIEIAERNALNAFATEEVDVALWNDQAPDGFRFLPYTFLVECKNWSAAVGTAEVAYFVRRCQNHGCDHGFLIAANGITGEPRQLTAAHYELATALKDGIRIVVLTLDEIEALSATEDLIRLIKRKLCQLMVSATSLLP